jgi:hypothetical protein
MAERAVVIVIARSGNAPQWIPTVKSFVDEHRDAIVADVRWHFEQVPAKLPTAPDRFALWEAEVVARVADPDLVIAQLKSRRQEIDVDGQDSEAILDHLSACLRRAGLPDPDAWAAAIPVAVLTGWVRELFSDLSARAVRPYVQQHVGPPRLAQWRTNRGRYYLWRGDRSRPEAETVFVGDDGRCVLTGPPLRGLPGGLQLTEPQAAWPGQPATDVMKMREGR